MLVCYQQSMQSPETVISAILRTLRIIYKMSVAPSEVAFKVQIAHIGRNCLGLGLADTFKVIHGG